MIDLNKGEIRKGILVRTLRDGTIKYYCRMWLPGIRKYSSAKICNTYEEALSRIQDLEFEFYSKEENRHYLPKGIVVDISQKTYKLQIIGFSNNKSVYISSNKDLESIIKHRVRVINSLLDI